MLGPQDVGHRVVVRRIVGVRDGRAVFSDTLGELARVDDDALVVAARSGRVRIPLDQVQAAKRVPDRRGATAREVAALELVANAAWPAPVEERLGDWLLRAADGWTGRANSALAVGDPGCELPGALDAVVGWYRGRALPPRVNAPLPLATRVDAELDARGWRRSPVVLVQTAALADVLAAVPIRDDPPVRLAERPDAAWLAMVAGFKGALPPAAHHVLTAPEAARYASVTEGGALVAMARGVLVDGYLHLGLLEVSPAMRRRGIGGLVTGVLARWAEQAGAHTAMLQVIEENEPAVALYGKLGFRTHHRYVTRTAVG